MFFLPWISLTNLKLVEGQKFLSLNFSEKNNISSLQISSLYFSSENDRIDSINQGRLNFKIGTRGKEFHPEFSQLEEEDNEIESLKEMSQIAVQHILAQV